MKVNNNISAVITNNQLLRTEDSLAASMERLSSGLKINHSKDNPSGMAISNKMQAQIDGLDQASRNSSDGTSVLETADGALNEVTQMLQRMRELAVQAANDTNSQSEKKAIQVEIDKLKEEVDRISSTTEFNTKSLLDGSLDNRCYASANTSNSLNAPVPDFDRISVTEEVPAGTYKMTVTPATQTTVACNGMTLDPEDNTTKIGENNAGIISVNGVAISIDAEDTYATAYQKFCDGLEIAEVEDPVISGGNMTLTSKFYGAENSITLDVPNANLAALFGMSSPTTTQGKNAELSFDNTSSFGTKATTYSADGNHVKIRQAGGFEMEFLINSEVPAGTTCSVDVTTMGPMGLQIGANEGQQMNVKIPACDTESLYIDEVDVTTVLGAQRAIAQCDSAIASINKVRSSLGAYTNRLESASKSLDETSENMNSAISRISDVDMALEMTEYTRLNVLSQTATSALSQANELPQLALQLLG